MPTPSMPAVWITVGAITTGRMCRRTIRESGRPETRAASTYSSSRTAVTDARINRYTPVDIRMPKTPIAT